MTNPAESGAHSRPEGAASTSAPDEPIPTPQTSEWREIESAPPSASAEALKLLAAIWFYGSFKAETFHERRLQEIMESFGLWPLKNEAALFRALDNPMPLPAAPEGSKP